MENNNTYLILLNIIRDIQANYNLIEVQTMEENKLDFEIFKDSEPLDLSNTEVEVRMGFCLSDMSEELTKIKIAEVKENKFSLMLNSNMRKSGYVYAKIIKDNEVMYTDIARININE